MKNERERLEQLYQGSDDPWAYATSPFEVEKYARTLEVLPRARYGTALEIGCSIGVFTQHLAGRVDRLLAIDIAAAAIERARARCAGLPGVRFERRDFIAEDIGDQFDLIVCAEVLYYIQPWRRFQVARKVAGWLAPGGDLVLVHQRRRRTRHWGLNGEGGAERLHRLFTHVVGLPVVAEAATADYIITVVRATPPVRGRWRRRAEVVRLAALTIHPSVRSLLRSWVRRHPRLDRLLQQARSAWRTERGAS